jgi:uncharacterized membrane protein (DUF485 family)
MTADATALIEKVERDPEFHALRLRRARLSWLLSAVMVAIYFGFILVVAFDPALLATPIGSGVTSLGIPLGIGVILAAFVLTGIYVHRANTDFDLATERIIERLK